MKTNQLVKALLVLLLFQFAGLQAQTKSQMFWVHEDRVKPSHLMEYEAAVKEVVAAMNEHNIADAGWISMSSNNFRYAYVGTMDKFADLDNNYFASLEEKMGKDAVDAMFDKMDAACKDHVNYTLRLDPELSYMPDGMTITPEGENYRENGIYYFSPSNMDKAVEIAKKFKDLYAEKGSKMHYRVYRSGFGADGTYLMVAIAAKDAADMEAKSNANEELLGDDLNALRGEILAIMENTREMKGWIRPDLGYSAKAEK